MTRKQRDLAAARQMVLMALRDEVKERARIVGEHERGSAGDAYRREIARLWRVAYRAAKGKR